MKNVAVIFLTCTQSAGALALPKNDYCSNHKEQEKKKQKRKEVIVVFSPSLILMKSKKQKTSKGTFKSSI